VEAVVLMKKSKRSRVQIERITKYEGMLNEAMQIIDSDPKSERLAQLVGELEAYYTGHLWKRDYADDEAGKLPGDLKKGVLSEDGIYDLLTRYGEADLS